MPKSISLWSVFVSLLAAPALAVTPSQVANINPGFFSVGSNPAYFSKIAGRALFVGGRNRGLWSTGGVPDDPVRLGSAGLATRSPLTLAGKRAYVSACDESGCGLWVTEGTPTSTRRLLRVADVSSEAIEAVAPAGLPRTLLIFTPGSQSFLWRTDGTPAGTRRVPLPALRPRGLVSFQGKGWFFADLPNAPGALFSTDGLGGTRRIGTSTGGSRLFAAGNRLMFLVGSDLWSSDGTQAGTRRLATLPESLVFTAISGNRSFLLIGSFQSSLRELWTSDGTPAGTRRGASFVVCREESPLLVLGGKVSFCAVDTAHGEELWSSDGTAAGTRIVKDVCPGECNGASEITGLGLGRIWFAGSTPQRGIELWTSDLTPAGTRGVRDTCPGSCSGNPRNYFAAGTRMYFGAGESSGDLWISDGTPGGTLPLGGSTGSSDFAASLGGSRIAFAGFDLEHGYEPWVSDGTPVGTRRLADLESENLTGSDPRTLMAAGGRAFFFANDGKTGRELWVTDGTEEGTRLAYDQNPGPGSTRLQRYRSAEAGERLVLFARESLGGDLRRLIGSDGTPAGSDSLLPPEVIPTGEHLGAGSRVFFFSDDPVHGRELWATDGTPGGTVRLTDFVASSPFRPSGGFPTLYALGDLMIIPVQASGGGEDLWISDGTPGGTKPLHEVYPFLEASFRQAAAQPARFGGAWYFLVSEAGTATLWRTDLTPGGTGRVDVLDLSVVSRGWVLMPLGEQLLVFGRTLSTGGLWASDGTALGTRIIAFPLLTTVLKPVVFKGRLWFLTEPSRVLWTTDGTTEGTAPFFEDQGSPRTLLAMHVVGDRLVIAMNFEVEFLATDGTLAGTVPVEVPGRLPSQFLELLGTGGRMYFPWNDPVDGEELWVLRPD